MSLHFDITGDNSNLLHKLKETRNGVRTTSNQIEESGMSIEQMFGRLAKGAAAFGAGITAKEIVSNIVRIRGEFQQLEVAFNTMLGGEEKADSLMQQLVKTAATTPFDLQSVANGAKQLLAYGTAAEDVNGTLIRLGDIAAGLSIPLGDLVYLYGTTMSQGRLYTQDLNQFTGRGIPMIGELAEQFGVAESEVKKLVESGKVGFPEVQKVIESLTNEGGKFGGLMEAQSKTITGQISNIEDAIDVMYNNIGKSSEGFIKNTLSGVSYLVENYEEIGKIVFELVGTYGAYKAILITITALQKVNSAVVAQAAVEQQFAALAGHKLSDAQALAAAKTKLLTIAQQGLTKSLKAVGAALTANPYIAVAAAIAGVSLAIYRVATAESEFDKTNKRLSISIKEAEKGALSEQRELAKLKGELSATAKGTEEYNKIRDEIASKYGKYKENLKDEIDKVGLLDTTYQNLTKSIQQAFDSRQYDKFKKEQEASLDEVMAKNLGKIQDRLYDDLGDEEGARVYTKIRNALWERKELDDDIKSTLDKVQDKGTIVADSRIDSYIKNITDAQKITDEFDKKARVKFGIDGDSEYEGGKGKGEENELSSISKEITDTTAKITKLKQELADLRSGKTSAEAGKTVQSAIEEKAKELAAAENALATLTGKDKTSDKKYEDEQKKLLEQQKATFLQLLDLRLQNQQAEIDLMEEGSEKKIAQINLDYDKEIAALLAKEKEWKEAQGGKLTDEQNVEIGTSLAQSYVKREKATGLVSSEQLELEKRMMNEYMAAYGDYQEKRLAITELYNEKISKATTEGERLSLGEEMKKALATADDEAQKKTSVITRLFADMSKKTVKDIRAIAYEAEDFLSFLENGEYSSDNAFGISKEQFDILRKSPDQLKSIKDEIANVNKEADQCETSFNKVSNGLKKVFSAGDDTKALKEGLEDINQGMNEIIQSGQFLADTFSKLGDSFGGAFSGIADGLNVAMDAMSSAMDGAKAGAMFGQIGMAAGAAIGVVSSLASAITKIHDKKNEKRIERLQSQIEVLDKSYEALDKAINKAYSNDASNLIDQQNKLLEQQKVLIQNQIKEEQGKKKTDDGRIKDWQNQIDEINNVIADNKEAGKDAIFGSDIKSAIDDFANAYAEAWSAGEDKAESAKDLIKKMIKGMIMESIKAAASDPMKAIREKLLEFWADDYISDWEQDYLDKEAQKLVDDLDKQFGWADKYFKPDGPDNDNRTASSKGIASISQDSANAIDGKMSSQLIFLDKTLIEVTGIHEQMSFIRELQTRGWEDVKAIRELTDKVSDNTLRIADMSEKIADVSDKIERNTGKTAKGIQDMNDRGVALKKN